MEVINVKVEYLTNPIGLGIKNPRITWNLKGIKKQTAFEIIYSINGQVFKSGVISSSSMNYIFQDDLKSRDIVRFKIKVFENEDYVLSSEYHFELGIDQDQWQGKWISGNYRPSKKLAYPVDYFKKEFLLSSIKKARLYITSLGIYEAYINGHKVSDFVLAPGSTDYSKRVQYQTYDVTSYLKKGNNEIKVLLADGWYRGSIGAKGDRYVFGKASAFLAQLEVMDDHNQMTLISSDDSWSWSNDGQIRFADLKDGEIVDFNQTPSFDKKAKEVMKKVNIQASNNNFIQERESFEPVRFFMSKTNKTIYEFKQNLAGILALKIKGHQGEHVDIVMGEILDENNDVTLKNIQCIKKGKKSPLQEIHLILKEGINEYKGRFTIAGFKYVSVVTTASILKIKQIALYTTLEETSTFSCSNPLINTFYQNTLWSLKSNSADVPTDCPTRERMGWTGDSQLFFKTACYLTNYAAFARKHLEDVFDRQDKNGRLPQIAPYNAEDWYMDAMNGSVGWADIGILMPYYFYKIYGDKRILENHFNDITRYAKFMISRCGRAKGIYAVYASPLHLSRQNKKYQVNTGQSYGEWAEPNDVNAFKWTDFAMPHPEESMAYTSYMMKLMIEICELLNHKEDLALYQEYEQGVKKAYQELVEKPKFSLDTDRQAKLVRPLYMNLLNEEQKAFAKKRLIEALDHYHWRLGTGFLSTPYILDVLSEINPEYAYQLLENEKMPGWLYMAKNNTGTIWEGWEGPNAQQGISSLNHYSKGALVEWLFKGMCGIMVQGENQFVIHPIIGGNICFAKASYLSIYGLISSAWEIKDDQITFKIAVPSNTSATFIYKNEIKLLESGTHLLKYQR